MVGWLVGETFREKWEMVERKLEILVRIWWSGFDLDRIEHSTCYCLLVLALFGWNVLYVSFC